MRQLPSYVGHPYPLDRYLGFAATNAVEPPHLLSSLSSSEKIRLNRSGLIHMKCQQLLDEAEATCLTAKLLQEIDTNSQLSQLNKEIPEIQAHMSYGCEFLGHPGAYSFFNWNEPQSILVNKDGSSQIDWHAMCADVGLDLRMWRWSKEQGKAVHVSTTDVPTVPGDVIAKCMADSPVRNGEAVIHLLTQITNEDFEQELLYMHLTHCHGGSNTLRHLCKDYVNHAFTPDQKAHRHNTLEGAVAAATKAFCESSSDPQTQAEDRALFASMLAPKKPTQLIAVNRMLGDLLLKQGAVVLPWGTRSLWCRYGRELARKDKDLEAVLVREMPDLMDEVIEEAMPDVARSLRARFSTLAQMEQQTSKRKNRKLQTA